MAYRNGTYIAFHANGTNRPGESDMDYYRMMTAWTANPDDDFTMVNSHDKASSVRDNSKRATLRASIQERLRNSKNMVLIVGDTTRHDDDWVPFEIEQAIDVYGLPVVAAYPGYTAIVKPADLASLWPPAIAERMHRNAARVIHIPFKKEPIMDAIGQFHLNNHPKSPFSYYSVEAHKSWKLL